MKVADKLEIKQLGRSTRYQVVIYKDGVVAYLRDVGIGISQVFSAGGGTLRSSG